jgi:class 3 adenylate cyclase
VSVSVCGACRQENPDVARFCLRCGAALASPNRREERRVVSVLFVDIVGFTSRAERLDPEDVRSFLTPYYERVRAEIESHGGRLEKFVGDAVLGIFGAPLAHGDDAERAVRTALALRDALREMNEAERELDLQVRIAVNTGEAIVDVAARPEAGEAMIVGDVVNTASRLQAAAPVNGILVGGETHKATRASISYAPALPVLARGKVAPIEVWLAVGAAAAPGERRSSEAPLVGRERELGLLERLWDQVCREERPQLVTVIGPAGIGKSRLGEEFAARVASAGGRALRGRSVPYGESSAYGAFAQHVKQVAGIFDNDGVALAHDKLVAAVSRIADPDAVLTESLALLLGFRTETPIDREGLFVAARRFVEGLARERPTALVFEDVHWADASLLDLVEALSARAQGVPLLFVALARPELYDERPSWGGGLTSHSALSLEPLDGPHAEELAALLLGSRSEVLAGRLAAVAEGNPLFIEELTAALAERGSGDLGVLPTTIRSLLAARLDALEPDERSILLDAAVAGKVFWRGVIERIERRTVGLDPLLRSLEERGLIRREAVSRIEGEEQYVFKHGLLHAVAYATVPRALRRERHAAVARFLEDRTTETGESAATLAFHWREAGDPERAFAYYVEAAEHAGRGWAKERAVSLYGDAFALLAEDDERRPDLNKRRAVALQTLFHVPDAARLAGRGPDGPA